MILRRHRGTLCGRESAESQPVGQGIDNAKSMYAAACELASYIADQPTYGIYGVKTLTNRVADMSFTAFGEELVANGTYTQDFKDPVNESFLTNDNSKRVFKRV